MEVSPITGRSPLDDGVKSGFRRHLTFGNTYRTLLRGYKSLPSDEQMKADNRSVMFQFCVLSLRVALTDTEDGRHERRTIMERVEGRPMEHKEIGITIEQIKETPLAKSLRDILVQDAEVEGRPKRLMVEAGPDHRDPNSGALFETIEPSDPRWRKDLPNADAVKPELTSNLKQPSFEVMADGDPLRWLRDHGFEMVSVPGVVGMG